MKQTLYQILGVDPKAAPEDIDAAYRKRVEEMAVATIQDPNKLIALQQSREILTDPNRRAAYDGSIAARAVPPALPASEPEPGFAPQRGKRIAVALVVVVIGVWWAQRGGEPQPQQPLPPPPAPSGMLQAVAPPDASDDTASSATPDEPAAQGGTSTDGAQVPAAAQTAEAPSGPLAGQWQCLDAITGLSSRYDFRPEGELVITASGSPPVTTRYETDGKALKIGDAAQSDTLAIEELGPKKAIFNAGAGGRRVVCTR